jgi:hypothetical protein
MAVQIPVLFCDDGSEIELPTRWEICGHCRGSGKSSSYLGAFTQDDMAEAGPDFCDEYMAGRYDRACDVCDGSGKVQTVDHARMTKAQRAEWQAQCQADDAIAAEERAERAFGC